MDIIEDKLLDKSKEAFILGIEIYNKPTISYRVEGFSFFICNAWELMLKSHLIKTSGNNSIYFKNNPERTISLENAIEKVFTNNKDPLRINLEKILELRNTSTHFVTEEYEMVYIPLFQSCVLNFSEKMMDFHGFDITTLIPQNFLTLNISMQAIESSTIIAKYPEEIASKLIDKIDEIETLSSRNNEKFALKIEHHHFLVKDKSKATSLVKIDKNANSNVKIIKDLKDPNQTHPYSFNRIVKSVTKRLTREGIDVTFNRHTFGLFIKKFDLKSNASYCYSFATGEKSTTYKYSQQVVDLIVNQIKVDPENIIENLKK